MKYTAIYVDSWMSGSHRHSITKMLRFEKSDNETIVEALDRHIDANSVVFIFHGHPLLQGEEL